MTTGRINQVGIATERVQCHAEASRKHSSMAWSTKITTKPATTHGWCSLSELSMRHWCGPAEINWTLTETAPFTKTHIHRCFEAHFRFLTELTHPQDMLGSTCRNRSPKNNEVSTLRRPYMLHATLPKGMTSCQHNPIEARSSRRWGKAVTLRPTGPTHAFGACRTLLTINERIDVNSGTKLYQNGFSI